MEARLPGYISLYNLSFLFRSKQRTFRCLLLCYRIYRRLPVCR